MEPVVTLHHFTNPVWMRDLGGWDAPAAEQRFTRYVEKALTTLEGVRRVCTVNEPNMIALWTGALASAGSTSGPRPDERVRDTLLSAHRSAVEVARAQGIEAGLTVAMTAYTTDGSDEAAAAVSAFRAEDEDPYLQEGRQDDFLGVQAYTRRFASAAGGVLPQGHDLAGPAAHQTLTGWNYYPQSIGECLRRAAVLAPGTPLVVTENGIATANDEERIAYTADALESVLGALSEGAPVTGYFHWSLLDNFEWVLGYVPRFGLIEVDRATFTRTPKPSARWFASVAAANAIA